MNRKEPPAGYVTPVPKKARSSKEPWSEIPDGCQEIPELLEPVLGSIKDVPNPLLKETEDGAHTIGNVISSKKVNPVHLLAMWTCQFSRSIRSVSSLHASSFPSPPSDTHRVVFMRHGESSFNNANIFTGWCDVSLTPRGKVEAMEAGEVFRSHQLKFGQTVTSLLTRSIVTAHSALQAAGIAYTPIEYDWRWNERHYGALQGLSKERTTERLGRDLVMRWRRSFSARPPLMTKNHPHYSLINEDERYKGRDMHIPLGESLEDCQVRVIDAWRDVLKKQTSDLPTLVVAHANSLRALCAHLDDISAEKIESLNIPTAIPFYYDVDRLTGEVVSEVESGQFRGNFIVDERKKHNFLERRRTANDPWVWALHDHEVASSMLVDREGQALPQDEVEEEAKHNTKVFSDAFDN